jgi:uncharacterized protein YbjT (DUF2867 family)
VKSEISIEREIETNQHPATGNTPVRNKEDWIVIAGAGGFIGGALTRYHHERGFAMIRAIDKKPLPDWYQRVPGVECLSMDLSEKANCTRACEGTVEVYVISVL